VFFEIFDEILVNAADNKQRDPNMKKIEVEINKREGSISVKNDGRGIPIEIHKKHKIYVPELIFGNLLTSSNYDDTKKKTVGGRNGYGAKLTNVFSTKFIIETVDSEKGKKYSQTWTNNMSNMEPPEITDVVGETDYTKVSFWPDLEKFKMPRLDKDIIDLFHKRVIDIAGTSPKDLKIKLKGKKIPCQNFQKYVDLYLPEGTKKVYEKVNDRWEICAATQENGKFMQVSHVNSIWTIKGGSHCNYVADQLCEQVMKSVGRRNKGVNLKNSHVKNHIFLFVNCLIENPAFGSQTKESMTTKPAKFGSKCQLSEGFLKKYLKTGIENNVVAWAKFRQSRQLKKQDGKKVAKVLGVPKLDDANDAGGKNSRYCTLILTEGDSAKALAVSGLSVVGRNRYGVFPLKGKLLNVRDASHKQIMNNNEIQNLRKIVGLKSNVDYSVDKNFESLRYGRIMIMTDQDHDGSHIKGLLINFIQHFWPSLLKRRGFLVEFITPIVVAKRAGKREAFYTIPEYERWKKNNDNGKGWSIKYYKGLGTSTATEAKKYFSAMNKHKLDFTYNGEADCDAIEMAFSKKRIEDRKAWLAAHRPGTYLNQHRGTVNYKDFINKELILFSIADCARSIPSIIDGLKPGQRKILYSCFKRKLKKDVKVAQLAGYVSEHSAYHHGEASLVGTIVGMAQNYIGSNNINLLYPSGQFGTRHQGGKDSASARYIFTRLCPITRKIFHIDDDLVMNYLDDDGQSVEPEWYAPIIPMVLVNGAEGIGTGWSTYIPNHNPEDVIENLRRMIRDEPPVEMDPWYKYWEGKIYREESQKFSVWGNCEKIGENKVRVDELPIRLWTENYKSFLEKMMQEDPPRIKDIRVNHTDVTVAFEIEFTDTFGFRTVDIPFLKSLRLISSMTTSNMVLFNHKGKIKRYNNSNAILKEFYTVRLEMYEKRKQALLDKVGRELEILSNKQRFIWMVVNEELEIRKKQKKVLVQELLDLKFTMLHSAQGKNKKSSDSSSDDDEDKPKELSPMTGFDYLLKMPIHSLTAEKVAELMQQKENKEQELRDLQAKPVKEFWREDLNELELAIQAHNAKEEAEFEKERTLLKKKKKRGQQKLITSPKRKRNYVRKQVGQKVFASPKKKKKKGVGRGRKKAVVEEKPKEHKIDKKLLKIVGNFGFLSDSDDDDMETVQSDAKKNAKKSLAERVKILQESSDDSSDEPLVQSLTKKATAIKPKSTIQAAKKRKPQFDSSDDEILTRPAKRRKLGIKDEESSDFMLEPPVPEA